MARRVFSNRTSGRQQSQRPNRSWAAIVDAAETTVPAASKVLLGTFTPSVDGIDEVVLRTRGVLAVRSDQTAGSELQIGAFGMIVVTDTAAAAGAASIPSPATDADDDGWFVWLPFAQRL